MYRVYIFPPVRERTAFNLVSTVLQLLGHLVIVERIHNAVLFEIENKSETVNDPIHEAKQRGIRGNHEAFLSI